ncbi:DUF1887 family protein [bacterium]|nr:DUF1887 family protein [bacterium]
MILVSILGDFHSSFLPLFFEFKHKIQKHILLHDDSEYDQKRLAKIMKGQEFFLRNFEDDNANTLNYEIVSLKIKEDNYESILQGADAIIAHTNNPTEIYLNSTDGLTSISLILANILVEIGSKIVVYDRHANTYNIHTKEGMTKHKIQNSMDVKNHLRLKGYDLRSFTNRFTLERRKPFIKEITQNLSQFKNFANTYPNTDSSKCFYKDLIQQMGEDKEQFVKGGIFEEYIYWLIKDNFAVDDIMTGVKIQFDKDVINEIDILIMKENHLHTIECKFSDNFKTTEYLYKVDSIIDYIDDDGKGMILTVGNKNIGDHVLARATNDNINFYAVKKFHEKQFLAEIKRWFFSTTK